MNRTTFHAALARSFGPLSASQVQGIDAILLECAGLPIAYTAACLGTGWLETGGGMQPVKETVFPYHKNKNPSDGTVIARLDKAWRDGRLGQVKTPYWRKDADGKTWFGRGLAQITHKDNYKRASALIGVDLVADPNRALEMRHAVRILVQGSLVGLFTGKKLADYLPGDYAPARRVINGSDRARDYAKLCVAFELALAESGWEEKAEIVREAPKSGAGRGKSVSPVGWISLALGGLVAAFYAMSCKIAFLAPLFDACTP
jgi:hypothetical protein